MDAPTDELLELGDDVPVSAEREIGLDAPLEHGEPKLLESRDRRLGEVLVRELGQGSASPQGERLSQLLAPRAPGARAAESATSRSKRRRSSCSSAEPSSVAGRPRDEQAASGPERLSELRNPDSQRRSARVRRSSPQSRSISRSVDTTSFACSRSTARSARCFDPRSSTCRSPSQTSSGPRILNSTGYPRSQASPAASTTSSRGATSCMFPIARPAQPVRFVQRRNEVSGRRTSSSSASSSGSSIA